MKPSDIVAFLLENEQEDPKDFVARTPRLMLDTYFTGTDAEGRSYRTTSTQLGYFTVSVDSKSSENPYVGLSWEIETGPTGGFGQRFVFKTDRDIRNFLADLQAVENAVTVDGNAALARSRTDHIASKTDYSRPYGYSDPRGRS